ncbi:hypothetical protein ACFPME_07370 [Rhodanobacter umsongensis]|uniref:Integrase n=1 Tax=Rhodanobacter umsongensis TaxID=633153 RepID=A0ABW0JJY2_9GAMM
MHTTRTLLPDRVILRARTMASGTHLRVLDVLIRLQNNHHNKIYYLLWHEATDISVPQWT